MADALIVGVGTNSSNYLTTERPTKLDSWNPSPLLVLPENQNFTNPNRLSYTADFMLEEDDYIFYLEKWLKLFNANLTVLYVNQEDDKHQLGDNKLAFLDRLFPNPNIQFIRLLTQEITMKTEIPMIIFQQF